MRELCGRCKVNKRSNLLLNRGGHYRFKRPPGVSLYISPLIIGSYFLVFFFNENFFDTNVVITNLKRIIHLLVIR
jgi:hypothetical protein